MGPGHQGLNHARPPDTKLGDRCIESLIKGVQLIKFVINVMSLPILDFLKLADKFSVVVKLHS